MIVAILVVPFLVGLGLIAGRSRTSGRTAALSGAVAMTVSLLLSMLVWDELSAVSGEVDIAWIEPLGARLHLGVTQVSWPFLLMTAFIGVLCCLWLIADDTSPTLVGLVLVTSASSMGVFVSLDALLLFVFLELGLTPMWFVIAWWGDSDGGRPAATRFLLFTVTGSALLLVGLILAALESGTLQILELRSTSLLAVVLICLGLAVTIPLAPLHTWLPDAHSTAPIVGSVLLAAVFLTFGVYGLIVFGAPSARFGDVAPWLASAGAIGIVWSALACYVQDDLRRLVAYSSIGHMGFVAMAIATRSDIGLAAAVFGSVAHGAVTGLLFFTAGSMKDRFGSTSIAAAGRGLYGRAPWLTAAFVLAALAGMGLPGLAGFWGELLALRAVYEVGDVLAKPVAWSALGVAVLGVVLTTAYFGRAIRLMTQRDPATAQPVPDVGRREIVVMGSLAVVVVALGLVPRLVLDLYGVA